MGFQLGNLYVEKGQKTCGFLKLPFTEDELPVTLIYGREEGPTVLVDGGIHNAEYVGIECVTGLAKQLQPEDIKGILIMIHIVNVNGFQARTVSVSAEDGKNLNRVFPGNENGTYTDKLAYFMEKEIFSNQSVSQFLFSQYHINSIDIVSSVKDHHEYADQISHQCDVETATIEVQCIQAYVSSQTATKFSSLLGAIKKQC